MSARSLKGRALQWLAQREHSRLELRRKLMPFARAEDEAALARAAEVVSASGREDEGAAFIAEVAREAGGAVAASDLQPHQAAAARVEAVLDWLHARQFQSQARFVESRTHARAGRFGNLRIRQELKQHELALPPDIAQALAETELDRARAVRERKFASWPEDAAERGRQARFLAGRGFSPEVISRVLRKPRPADHDEGSEPAAANGH